MGEFQLRTGRREQKLDDMTKKYGFTQTEFLCYGIPFAADNVLKCLFFELEFVSDKILHGK